MDDATQQMTERLLRAAVLAGDEAAWEYLYRAHFDRLYAHAWHRAARDRHLSEELVQEAWLVAVRKIRTFDPDRGTFHQWMRGIIDHLALNQRRRQRFRRTHEFALEADAAVAAPSVAATEQIDTVMADLPGPYQDVLKAKYQQQNSVREIAAGKEMTPKAVESLLSRARVAFRAAWRRLEEE